MFLVSCGFLFFHSKGFRGVKNFKSRCRLKPSVNGISEGNNSLAFASLVGKNNTLSFRLGAPEGTLLHKREKAFKLFDNCAKAAGIFFLLSVTSFLFIRSFSIF